MFDPESGTERKMFPDENWVGKSTIMAKVLGMAASWDFPATASGSITGQEIGWETVPSSPWMREPQPAADFPATVSGSITRLKIELERVP